MQKALSWVLLLSFVISGCVSTRPDRFASIEEAYPEGQLALGPDVSTDSYKKTVLDAPYEEVFNAARAAIAQIKDDQGNNIISVESSDPAKGTILATGLMMGRRFYAVNVKKIGRERTEIMIGSKVQKRCVYFSPLDAVAASVLTLGIAIPFIIIANNECDATVHWAPDANIIKILAGTRNNLIQAGNL